MATRTSKRVKNISCGGGSSHILYIPLQLLAGVYPFEAASSFEVNQILFVSEICFAPGHDGRWYLVPFLEPTYIPLVSVVLTEAAAVAGFVSLALEVAVLPSSVLLAPLGSVRPPHRAGALGCIAQNFWGVG